MNILPRYVTVGIMPIFQKDLNSIQTDAPSSHNKLMQIALNSPYDDKH